MRTTKLALLSCSLLLVLTCETLAQVGTSDPESTIHRIDVVLEDRVAWERLLALDLDLAACGHGVGTFLRVMEVLGTNGDLARIRAVGLRAEVAIHDLQAHYARELARHREFPREGLVPPLGQGSMGGHYTFAEMLAILDSFHTNHPNLCSPRISIGTTHEGRQLWMVKISDDVQRDEPEPEVLYTGLHHAREPVSMSALLLFMDELLSGYGTDPDATYLVDHRELYFVPCVNPDGYVYNEITQPGGGGLWRKNRRDNGNGTIGVDLNRNYPVGWTAPNGGNSSSPSSSTYRGPFPLSEPETVALDAFARGRSFVQVLNAHTYTEVLLHPQGYTASAPTNQSEYDTLAAELRVANPMPYGTVFAALYPIAGGATDHFHHNHGAYAWLPELGFSSEGGFWPNPTNTRAIARRHQVMFRELAWTSGARLAFETVTVVEGPGGNGNGQVEPGERGLLTFTYRNEYAGPSGAVQVSLHASAKDVTIATAPLSLASVPGFGSGGTTSQPFAFDVTANPTCPSVDLTLRMVHDDRVVEEVRRTFLTAPPMVVDDDMERDRGFAQGPVQSAVTGRFERAAPEATTNAGTIVQPGHQHTTGGVFCWVTDARAGSRADDHDVDGGATELISPVLDLSGMDQVEVRFWYWLTESTPTVFDGLSVAVSLDGGANYATVHQEHQSTNGWNELRIPFHAVSDRVRLRITVQDFFPSLVEGLVDDFSVVGHGERGHLVLLSSFELGKTLRLGLSACRGDRVYAMGAPTRIPPVVVPGIGGTLQLDPTFAFPFVQATIGSTFYAGVDLTLPSQPELVGVPFHWQTVVIGSNDLTFGPARSMTFR